MIRYCDDCCDHICALLGSCNRKISERQQARAASVGRNAERHDNEDWRGPKDEHAVGAAETPNTPRETPEPGPPVKDEQ